jgi:hypothetical protein
LAAVGGSGARPAAGAKARAEAGTAHSGGGGGSARRCARVYACGRAGARATARPACRAARHAEGPTHGGRAVLDADHAGVGGVRHGGVGELQAGGPAVVDDVVHLAGDLVVGEGGQVREGLEEPGRGRGGGGCGSSVRRGGGRDRGAGGRRGGSPAAAAQEGAGRWAAAGPSGGRVPGRQPPRARRGWGPGGPRAPPGRGGGPMRPRAAAAGGGRAAITGATIPARRAGRGIVPAARPGGRPATHLLFTGCHTIILLALATGALAATRAVEARMERAIVAGAGWCGGGGVAAEECGGRAGARFVRARSGYSPPSSRRAPRPRGGAPPRCGVAPGPGRVGAPFAARGAGGGCGGREGRSDRAPPRARAPAGGLSEC